jgi:predicted RNA-binding protein YlxR (DUF448 family)
MKKIKPCYICGERQPKESLVKVSYSPRKSVFVCPDHQGVQGLLDSITIKK